MKNQCDECAAGYPVNEQGIHVVPYPSGSMVCQRNKYSNNKINIMNGNNKEAQLGAGVDFNAGFGNFDPGQIQTDETINAVFVIDKSGSMSPVRAEMNAALNDFVETMQKSHVADRLFVKQILFGEDVVHVTGFQPITNVNKFDINPMDGATALFDGVSDAVDAAIQYREQLEATGVNTKTLIFVITDGGNNHGSTPAHVVKQKFMDIKKNEKNAFTFTSILFGLGTGGDFKMAQQEMGIDHMAPIGTTGAEIRKMIGFISSSISNSANGQNPTTNVVF
jgi:uncharacterized protein YegL